MFSPTLPRARLASTRHGMRRILKQKGRVSDYLRQATESGTYRTNEELEKVWRERRESAEDLRVVMRRFRQDIVRGTAIQDYPIEYRILMQHPPVPDPPRIPKKLLRKMKPESNPVEPLVQKYLNRQKQQLQQEQHDAASSASNSTDTNYNNISSDEYYRRILGIPSSAKQGGPLALKSAAVQKAYNAAVHHYRLQRTSAQDDVSEEQIMQQVDELLQQQGQVERERAREQAQAVQEAVKEHKQEETESTDVDSNDKQKGKTTTAPPSNTTVSNNKTLATVLGSPRTVEAMMKWSERLAAVPYKEWTVGASTALDHWIARQVLQLEEETWLTLLEGTDPALLEEGRQIVAIRETLFPETALTTSAMTADMQDGDAQDEEDTAEQKESDEKSVEELLASLGALHTPTTTTATKSSSTSWDDTFNLDSQVSDLMDQLQNYRRQHAQQPYAKWSKSDQDALNIWIQQDYVPTLLADQEHSRVDVAATRQALLSVPPTTAHHVFWSRLEQVVQMDENAAIDEELVQSLDNDETYQHLLPDSWMDLPGREQWELLANLHALRPLLDDYTPESTRQAFVQHHAHDLLARIPMEHLVADPDGPIGVEDLPPALRRPGMDEKQRYRLVLETKEQQQEVLRLWNQQKVGRALYEERLFQTGRLGLRYSDPAEREN